MKLRLKEIIKEKGIKQKKIAETLGLTPTGFNLIVNNKTTPSIETLERIASLLDVPFVALINEEEKREDTFVALINDNGTAYAAHSPEELRVIASRL